MRDAADTSTAEPVGLTNCELYRCAIHEMMPMRIYEKLKQALVFEFVFRGSANMLGGT